MTPQSYGILVLSLVGGGGCFRHILAFAGNSSCLGFVLTTLALAYILLRILLLSGCLVMLFIVVLFSSVMFSMGTPLPSKVRFSYILFSVWSPAPFSCYFCAIRNLSLWLQFDIHWLAYPWQFSRKTVCIYANSKSYETNYQRCSVTRSM